MAQKEQDGKREEDPEVLSRHMRRIEDHLHGLHIQKRIDPEDLDRDGDDEETVRERSPLERRKDLMNAGSTL